MQKEITLVNDNWFAVDRDGVPKALPRRGFDRTFEFPRIPLGPDEVFGNIGRPGPERTVHTRYGVSRRRDLLVYGYPKAVKVEIDGVLWDLYGELDPRLPYVARYRVEAHQRNGAWSNTCRLVSIVPASTIRTRLAGSGFPEKEESPLLYTNVPDGKDVFLQEMPDGSFLSAVTSAEMLAGDNRRTYIDVLKDGFVPEYTWRDRTEYARVTALSDETERRSGERMRTVVIRTEGDLVALEWASPGQDLPQVGGTYIVRWSMRTYQAKSGAWTNRAELHNICTPDWFLGRKKALSEAPPAPPGQTKATGRT